MVDGKGEINQYGESIKTQEGDSPLETEPTVNIDTAIGKLVQTALSGLGVTPQEVYIPGSGTDVLPSIPELRNSHILYADIDERAVKILQKGGYDAVVADIELTPPPQLVDLLVLNGISVNTPLSSVRKGGLVLSDGRMGSATNIALNHLNCPLIGIIIDEETIDSQGNKQVRSTVKQDGLDPFFKNLRRTEEEMAEARKSLRMALLGATPLPKAEKPLATLPPVRSYVFQKQ